MVKKRVIFILIFITTIFLLLWGILLYNRWQSFDITVPKSATALVKINVERLAIDYFEFDFLKEKKKNSILNAGLEKPLNIFAAFVSEQNTNGLMFKLKINDEKAFQQFLQQNFSSVNPENPYWLRHSSNFCYALYNADACVFYLGTNVDSYIEQQMQDYLLNKNTIAFKDSKFKVLKEKTGDIAMLAEKWEGAINFERGNCKTKFVLHEKIQTALKAFTMAVPEDAEVALLYAGNVIASLRQFGVTSFTDSLSTTDVEPIFDYGTALFFDGETAQTEDIVTYDYNDDFEKVEVHSHQEKKWPKLFFSIPLKDSAALYSSRVLLSSDSFNKAIFPLFSLHPKIQDNVLLLSSEKNAIIAFKNSLQLKNTELLTGWINFEKINQFQYAQGFPAIIKSFSKLEMSGRKSGNAQTEFEIMLRFKNTQRNAFRQLLEWL